MTDREWLRTIIWLGRRLNETDEVILHNLLCAIQRYGMAQTVADEPLDNPEAQPCL